MIIPIFHTYQLKTSAETKTTNMVKMIEYDTVGTGIKMCDFSDSAI